jgi:GMP synthase-like glutamine amidotransferase
MRRALVLKHVPQEGPGRIAQALRAAGFTKEVLELWRGDALPETLDGYAALVVMGGPMGVSEIGDPRFAFLAGEARLLERAVASDFPTLGVCLGAQLLAHAAGARVYANELGEPPVTVREVGWGAIHFVEDAAAEPVLAGLDAAETVFHWHGDTFDLPAGAVLLASTLHCKNQMFRLGRRQFALQFHVEVESADIESWLESDAEYVRAALGPNGRARVTADTARYMPRYRERGDRLLENLVALWSSSTLS